MAISIDKIVNVNFNIVKTYASIGAYKKTLFVTTSEESEELFADAKDIFTICGGKDANKNITLLTVSDLTDVHKKILEVKTSVAGTEDDFIFVCFDSGLSKNITAETIQKIDTFVAPNRVCVCLSLPEDTDINLTNCYAVVKLYPSDADISYNKEVCLSIPAYYSNINLGYANSIQDYAYTSEPMTLSKYTVENGQKVYSDWITNSADYDDYIEKYNFVEKIGNDFVNFGGNLTKDEISISSYFGAIAAENDVVYAVLRGMLKKQYLTDGGLNNIVALINQAMVRYTRNGFLQTNSTWTGDDFESKYTGKTQIKKGAVLPDGYYVATVPMSQLTPEDRRERKFTPITVFMQTQQGARIIEIDGNVLE